MLEQCLALIQLKLRLMRAMWTGAHTASLLLTVITLFGMLVLSVAGSVALFFVGWKLIPSMHEPTAPILVLDAITLIYCMFWASGLLMELQRSDVIDLRKMLYLPISPRMVFGMNFVASLFGPSLIFFRAGSAGPVDWIVPALWAARVPLGPAVVRGVLFHVRRVGVLRAGLAGRADGGQAAAAARADHPAADLRGA